MKDYSSQRAVMYGPQNLWYHVMCFATKRDEIGFNKDMNPDKWVVLLLRSSSRPFLMKWDIFNQTWLRLLALLHRTIDFVSQVKMVTYWTQFQPFMLAWKIPLTVKCVKSFFLSLLFILWLKSKLMPACIFPSMGMGHINKIIQSLADIHGNSQPIFYVVAHYREDFGIPK